MRILILNVNSHTGSTGKIAYGLLNHLRSNGHQALLCCRGVKEETVDDKDVIQICSRLELNLTAFFSKLTGWEGSFNYISTYRLLKIIKAFDPDLVQLYNLHGYYVGHFRLLRYLKRGKIPVVYSMLDEFPYMGKCTFPIGCEKFKTECRNCHRLNMYPNSWIFDNSSLQFNKKKLLYEGFDRLLFTGPPYVCKRAKESALLRNMEVEILDEPIDFDNVFYPRDTRLLRDELGIAEQEIVVLTAVSASSPRKGGQYFVEIAKKMERSSNIRFIYIGYDRNDWTFPSNMIVKGYVSSQSLMAEYFSLADLYVCTSLGDTTPNVCMNALGCGTPIAGFNDGGVVDCAPNEFGHFVEKLDIDALVGVIKTTKKKSDEESQRIREYAYSRFSQKIIYKKQIEIYNKLINK